MISGIYKITIDKYFYIGFSKNIEKRIKTHIRLLNKHKHENKKMQNVYSKYSTYSYEVLEETTKLVEREIFWMNKLGFPSNNCLNIVEGGGNPPVLTGEKNHNFGKMKGKYNPAFGIKRPDLSIRNKINPIKHSKDTKTLLSIKQRKIDYNSIYLKSPFGEKVCLGDYVSFREFCAQNKVDRSSLNRIITGKKSSTGKKSLSYKGWTLWQ